MMNTPPAPRFFFTCCWLVLVATLLVGPTITSNSGAHAGSVAQTRIAHWNFNNGQITGTTYALPVAASSGVGSATSNFAVANVQTTSGSTINLVSGEIAGNDLTMANNANNGGYLDFTFNSVGYIDITLTLALRRTVTGFSSVAVQTNGVTRASIAPTALVTYELMTVDLSAYAEIEDNPAAVVRLVFTGATAAAGNNRLDNVQFLGTAAAAASPSPTASSSVSPTASPSASTSVSPTTSPSILQPFPIVHRHALAFRDLVALALLLDLAHLNCVAFAKRNCLALGHAVGFNVAIVIGLAQFNCVAFAQCDGFSLGHAVGFDVAIVVGLAVAIVVGLAVGFGFAFRLGFLQRNRFALGHALGFYVAIVIGLAISLTIALGFGVAFCLCLLQRNRFALGHALGFYVAVAVGIAIAVGFGVTFRLNRFALGHAVGFYIAVVIGIAVAVGFGVAFRLGLV